jgi:hypothetical protein
MRTTIPIMAPLQCNDFQEGRGTLLRSPSGVSANQNVPLGSIWLTDRCARHAYLRPAPI